MAASSEVGDVNSSGSRARAANGAATCASPEVSTLASTAARDGGERTVPSPVTVSGVPFSAGSSGTETCAGSAAVPSKAAASAAAIGSSPPTRSTLTPRSRMPPRSVSGITEAPPMAYTSVTPASSNKRSADERKPPGGTNSNGRSSPPANDAATAACCHDRPDATTTFGALPPKR